MDTSTASKATTGSGAGCTPVAMVRGKCLESCPDLSITAVILRKGWSNWATTLKFLGIMVLQDTELTDNQPTPTPRANYVCLSGDWEWVQRVWKELNGNHNVIATRSLGSKPVFPTRSRWCYLQHKDYDGITDGGWWCGASCQRE